MTNIEIHGSKSADKGEQEDLKPQGRQLASTVALSLSLSLSLIFLCLRRAQVLKRFKSIKHCHCHYIDIRAFRPQPMQSPTCFLDCLYAPRDPDV